MEISVFLFALSSCRAQMNFSLWVCRWQYLTRNAHMQLLTTRTHSAFKLDDYIQMPCLKCGGVLPEFEYIIRPQLC